MPEIELGPFAHQACSHPLTLPPAQKFLYLLSCNSRLSVGTMACDPMCILFTDGYCFQCEDEQMEACRETTFARDGRAVPVGSVFVTMLPITS